MHVRLGQTIQAKASRLFNMSIAQGLPLTIVSMWLLLVSISKVHGAFKGTADLDCLQYLIAKWYANILGWEISCVVMSCNIKVDTQKVHVHVYIYGV